jgi:hypothetical protein
VQQQASSSCILCILCIHLHNLGSPMAAQQDLERAAGTPAVHRRSLCAELAKSGAIEHDKAPTPL